MDTTTQLPITYRDYTIKRGEHTKFEFVHNEYDGPGDNRLGACDTLEDCMAEIDEQVDGKESGSYRYDDSLFKAVAELTKPVEEEQPKSSLYNLLHHSEIDLDILLVAIQSRLLDIEPDKETMKYSYSTLTTWKSIVFQAVQDKKAKMNEMAA